MFLIKKFQSNSINFCEKIIFENLINIFRLYGITFKKIIELHNSNLIKTIIIDDIEIHFVFNNEIQNEFYLYTDFQKNIYIKNLVDKYMSRFDKYLISIQ